MEELIVEWWEEKRLTGATERTTPAPLRERLDSCPAEIQRRQKHTCLNTQTPLCLQGQGMGRVENVVRINSEIAETSSHKPSLTFTIPELIYNAGLPQLGTKKTKYTLQGQKTIEH